MKISLILTVFLFFLIYGCTNNFQVKSELQIGDEPYDFTVVTTEGKAVRLSDFTENKKPVIVYFFATWCPWCAKDYAALSKVYKNYEDEVGILSDRKSTRLNSSH